jgi:inhibitor of KinA
MKDLPPYKIFALGDSALVIDFGNLIDEPINQLVHSLFYHFKNNPLLGVIETVPAYSSLTVYYDVLTIRKKINSDDTAFESLSSEINKILSNQRTDTALQGELISIPVCYEKEFAHDLEWIAIQNNISLEEIISLHTAASYHVYMLGFLPGFAYMGLVNDKISVPRKQKPVTVEAGSVGIAGKQTGIYPLSSPGGWQIVGRTPMKLFDKEKESPTLIKSGDSVQFYSITKDEFEDIKSRNA